MRVMGLSHSVAAEAHGAPAGWRIAFILSASPGGSNEEACKDEPVIKAPTPGAAAQEIRTALPKAKNLHEQAKPIGSASEETIRAAGFDVVPTPSTALPNHHRIIHPEGVAGFNDANLARLAEAFVNTTGH